MLCTLSWASVVAQLVKSPPAMWETQVRFLGWENLEKEMAVHTSILAWRIPWTEEPGRLSWSMESQKLDMTETLRTAQHLLFGRYSGKC